MLICAPVTTRRLFGASSAMMTQADWQKRGRKHRSSKRQLEPGKVGRVVGERGGLV